MANPASQRTINMVHYPGGDVSNPQQLGEFLDTLQGGTLPAALTLSGDISPAALSGNVDNYDPSGLTTAAVLRIDGGAADRNITGIAGGADGRILLILNVGTTNSLILKNETTSTAANRFLFGADMAIRRNGGLAIVYDSTSSRWRPLQARISAGTGLTGGNNTSEMAIDTAVVAQLTATNAWTKQQGFALATLTDAATISWNLQTQQTAVVTLGGNRTLDAPSNMVAGFTYILKVIQDGTGTRTLAYHADYLFPGGVDPVLSLGAGDVDILSFYSDGSKMYGTILKDFS